MTVLIRTLLVIGGVYLFAGDTVAEEVSRTIYVSGTADIELEPDMINWKIDLRDSDFDPLEAKKLNDERFDALIKLAKDLDIEPSDVVIGGVSIDKKFTRNKDNEYIFTGYIVAREVEVVQREFDDFDEMLERLAGFKAEFHVSYGSTEVREAKRNAQLAAVRTAREKAQAIAGALGQRVGRPLSITDHDVDMGFDLNDTLSNTANGGGDRDGTRYGSIKVRSGVDIRFELLDQ
ncbi:MAG: SIMPL domain-containing protein [Planctomycetota bacterium]